jgi:hypothetical protein
MILYLHYEKRTRTRTSSRNKSNTETSNYQQIKYMEEKINTLELYRGLRKFKGSITQIATDAALTPRYVSLVLQQKRQNLKVVALGATLLKELKVQQLEKNQATALLQEEVNQAVNA